jgi:hypothetical protein
MQTNEQLVHRCLVQSELEKLQGNDYIAELLQDCANALCVVQS